MTSGSPSVGGNPWADPATPTQPGPPYAGGPVADPYPGPPPTAPPPHGPHGYGGYGYPSQAPPTWPGSPWEPRRPQRPGQVVGAAVLAFVQAAIVLVASVYVWFLASLARLAGDAGRELYPTAGLQGLAREGSTLALVQALSAIVLIAGGLLVLNRRTRVAHLWLVAALVVQVLLAGYWTVRLVMLLGAIPGNVSPGAMLGFILCFAAMPAVGLGLVLLGPGQRWFDGTPPA